MKPRSWRRGSISAPSAHAAALERAVANLLGNADKFAEDHGGHTFVHAPDGGGSEIGFTIPVVER